jgi:prefoldin subunit 5
MAVLGTEMSTEMQKLRSEVSTLRANHAQASERIEELQTSLKELEEVVMRELIEDPPIVEVEDQSRKKKKKST